MSTEFGILAQEVSVEINGRGILHKISCSARRGQVTGLIGPNGAGKSTLLGVLSGDLHPTTGSVLIDALDPRSTPDRILARHRAVMMQDTSVAFSFLVRDVVEMGRHPWKNTPASQRDEEIINSALAVNGLSHLAGRDVMTLSGGERARTALARVLAQQAEVLLLDEPTAAMDIRHQEHTMGLVRELARAGRTVLVVLHDLAAAAAYCDHVICLKDGQVAAQGSVAEVYTEETLSEVYSWPLQIERSTGGQIVVNPRPWSPHREENLWIEALASSAQQPFRVVR